jgi:hypothetical protein
MGDWVKDIQSVNRGFRPGMEVNIATSRKNAKSVWIDGWTEWDWEHVLLPHWAEHISEDGERVWRSYTNRPPLSDLYHSNRVVLKNKDGTFEYIKNRDGMGERVLNEQEEKEFLFIMLSAEVMHR